MPYSLLNTLDSPADLRRLSRGDLGRVAIELRDFIIDTVSKTGGHLSSNLGTVELTVALHYVYNTPHDRLVWDVGHQTYPHKILTGRKSGMVHLRQKGGLAGFPRREESPYDTFGTAHSSTSISAALGMALASRLNGEKRHAVAVIGDELRSTLFPDTSPIGKLVTIRGLEGDLKPRQMLAADIVRADGSASVQEAHDLAAVARLIAHLSRLSGQYTGLAQAQFATLEGGVVRVEHA